MMAKPGITFFKVTEMEIANGQGLFFNMVQFTSLFNICSGKILRIRVIRTLENFKETVSSEKQ